MSSIKIPTESLHDAYERGRREERERCAKIAERPRIQDAMTGEVAVSADGKEIARHDRLSAP